MIDPSDFLEVDAPVLLSGSLAALACGLLGNFLVLQRRALVVDAVGHAVLPGIVVGFLVTGTTSEAAMFAGALAASVLAVAMIEFLQRAVRIEPGAAIAVVLTSLFALGVVVLERSDARSIHLDVQHALMGSLETVVWLGAEDWSAIFDPERLLRLPSMLVRLLVVTVVVVTVLFALAKEFTMVVFDPAHARSLGIPVRFLSLLFLLLCAVTAVASFQAVGAILTVAMFVCPAATARMFTDRLRVQIALSALVALLAGASGYALAAWAPLLCGFERGFGAAGGIALAAGILQTLAVVFAPRYGILVRRERV
ncbi:MAG: metal ABC transporter permease [Geminicoccaceae bacterium]|nr:metal ABC transporter permease [Geminicoccaceae bacterium]MDW8124216.1 metal ABC transporter permease [Geminicoccaceae bacterium]